MYIVLFFAEAIKTVERVATNEAITVREQEKTPAEEFDDNNGGGDNPSPSDYHEKLAECRDAARDFASYAVLCAPRCHRLRRPSARSVRCVARRLPQPSACWLKDDMIKDGVLLNAVVQPLSPSNALLSEWTDDDFARLKEACQIDASLFGKELGHWTVFAHNSPENRDSGIDEYNAQTTGIRSRSPS